MITPRDYQVEAIQAVRDKYRLGVTRPLISLPTGTGKTICFSLIAQGGVKRGNRVLILAHRDELITQAVDKLAQVAPELIGQTGIVQGPSDNWEHPVTVASVQSLHARRRARIKDALGPTPWSIGIVDEAHHVQADSYQHLLDDFGFLEDNSPLLVGVTATPQRADGKDLGETFTEMVYHRDILWMIRQGYLCDLRGIQVKLQMDLGGVRVTAGDYNQGQLSDALTAAEAPHHIVGAWMRHAKDRKRTLVFTPTVALADDIAERFKAAGVTAVNISAHADDRQERRDILRRFKAGEIQVITNALLLTEGFDEPLVDCIVVARPTRSQPLYQQMVGRGTRTAAGKDDCLVLDMVGASERHDLTTLARMFGLGDDDATREQIEREGAGAVAAEREDEEIRQGRVKAKRIDLFTRAELHWTEVSPRLWVLSLGERSAIHLDASGGDTWMATVHAQHEIPNVLGSGLSLGYAMGLAEDYHRTLPPRQRAVASRNAEWREAPATANQIQLLRRANVAQAMMPDDQLTLTRGEASDLITAVTARWERRRRR